MNELFPPDEQLNALYVQGGAMYLSHFMDPHGHTIALVDHRPPWRVIAFIERYE